MCNFCSWPIGCEQPFEKGRETGQSSSEQKLKLFSLPKLLLMAHTFFWPDPNIEVH